MPARDMIMALLSHSSPQTPTSTARHAALGLINLILAFESIQIDSRMAHLGTLMVAGSALFRDFSIQCSIAQPSLLPWMLSLPEAYNKLTAQRQKLSIIFRPSVLYWKFSSDNCLLLLFFAVQELNEEVHFFFFLGFLMVGM